MYDYVVKISKDSDTAKLADTLVEKGTVPTGFTREQRLVFVKNLIDGYLGKDNLSADNIIRFNIPQDGSFEIPNNPKKCGRFA